MASGFGTVVLVNGHGGNAGAARCAVDAASLALEATVACCSYWETCEPDALPRIEGRIPGHAGAFETSLMLAVAPELVNLDAMRPSPLPAPARVFGAHVPTPPRVWREIDGFTDDPRSATCEIGVAALDVLASGVAGCLDDVWRLGVARG
jgi:creatinine amidohydrolase